MLQPYSSPPMLRYNKVVCIILQLNPSRHFSVCVTLPERDSQFANEDDEVLQDINFVDLVAKSSVYVWVCFLVFSILLFLKRKPFILWT